MRYFELLGREVEEDFAGRAVRTLTSLTETLTAQPNIANNVWAAYINFARVWSPDAAPEITIKALDLVASIRPHTSLRYILTMHETALRAAVQFGVLRGSDLRVAMDPFRWRSDEDKAGATFVLCLAAAAASDSADVSLAASRALGALVYQRGASLRSPLMEFVEAARPLADWPARLHLPSALFRVGKSRVFQLTAKSLLANLRWAELPNRRWAAELVWERWNKDTSLASWVVNAMLRLDAPDLAAELLGHVSAPSPTQRCLWAAIYAQQGQLNVAREELRLVLGTYRREGRGAHPHAVHRAMSSMAAESTGDERKAYLLVHSLMSLGPLNAQPLESTEADEIDAHYDPD